MGAFFGAQFGQDLAALVKQYVGARMKPLEARIAELEARPEPRYCGVWKADESYQPGNMTTDHGALWYCNQTTTARPGSGAGSGWSLAVKSGSIPRPHP